MHPILFQVGLLAIPSYGACASLGLLLALGLAQYAAPRAGLSPRHLWNLLVLAVFASLALSRLVLIAINLSDLRQHPSWFTAIALIHHPLLAAIGIVGASMAILAYARWAKLPLLRVADALSGPVSVALAGEQLGALLAGSDFGRESSSTSIFAAVTYSSALANRWSGTPLGIPLYPVQAYAAGGALLLAALTFGSLYLPRHLARRSGDVAGIWLAGAGALLFATEIFRDWEGRGILLRGFVNAPQLVGLGMVLLGGVLLLDRPREAKGPILLQ